MIDPQTLTLTATGLVLAVAAIRARADLSGSRWPTSSEGRAALHVPARKARRRTASELLTMAASQLLEAVQQGRTWDARQWAMRARHLARTVQATEARRARYHRAAVAA